MRAQSPYIKIILLAFSIMMSLLAWGQSPTKGGVTITATPERICDGGFSVLQAVATNVIDFETGNFSQYSFQNTGTYPWVVVSTETMDGSVYCMKSSNGGIASSTSTISATYTFTTSGSIRFEALCMGEGIYTMWDACTFKIDGTVIFEYGANVSGWNSYGYNVSAGSHTFTWSYTKDSSVNNTGDAFFVDNIVFSSQIVDGGSFLGQTFDFENGSFQGWTNIDADGDNIGWKIGSYSSYYYDEDLVIPGYNSSNHCVYSESWVYTTYYYDYDEYAYQFYGSPVTPNNYLVSPSKVSIHNGAYISFWACGVSQWPAEHFGVAISTANSPNHSNFTTIKEWTMTSKDDVELTRGGIPYQGTWKHYTVDLSAYAGQNLWVAIRHFNCTDQFYLAVDDITIFEGSDDPGGGGGDDNISYHWEPINQDGQSVTVWPTETTTYTVTASQNNNIIGTASKTVVVYTDLNLSITTNVEGNTICEEDTITLYVTADPPEGAMIGDILCTDGTWERPSDWPVAGKTAKGVVFYVDGTGQHGWAVGLVQTSKTWSSVIAAVPGLRTYSHWMDALTDLNGLSNTERIRSAGNSSQYPAAWACDFENGWYLPAIGQLNTLYASLFEVNASLTVISSTTIPITGNMGFWSSSTSTSNNYSLRLLFKNGEIEFNTKGTLNYVRQVTDF